MAAITDDRIDHIVRMMLTGVWKGMKSHVALGEDWGCHPRTVGTMAERAHAIIARRGQPIELEIDQALADLEQIKRLALDNERCTVDKNGEAHYYASPMLREATEAITRKLEILGVMAKARGSKEKPHPEDDMSKLTPEQMIAKLEEALTIERAKMRNLQ